MGNEASIRNCIISKKHVDWPQQPKNSGFTLYRGAIKHLKDRASIFSCCKTSETNECKREKNNVEVLKTLRHPSILKYIQSYEGKSEVILITEEVIPLTSAIGEMSDMELFCGIHSVLDALVFLGDKAGLSHNSLSLGSVFISVKDGTWKLGCFEEATKSSAKGRGKDANAFGEFSLEVLENVEFQANFSRHWIPIIKATFDDFKIYMKSIGEPAVKQFINLINRDFIPSDEKTHGNLERLLFNPIFKNDFLEVYQFLNEITCKTGKEKDLFFRLLGKKIRGIPYSMIAQRLVPMFLSKLILIEANPIFIVSLLTFNDDDSEDRSNSSVKSILPGDLFREHCIPFILKLFETRDIDIRLILLEYFGLYARAMNLITLEDCVLPELLLGLSDSDDRIVAATFKALSDLTLILGGEKVVGSVRTRHFLEWKPALPRSEDACLMENSSSQSSFETATSSSLITDFKRSTSEDNTLASAKAAREQKRLEREQQRAERQARRQKFRAEQAANKSKGIGSRVSATRVNSIENGRQSDTGETSPQSTYYETQSRVTASASSSRESEPKDESEAEWEGFEAQSSEPEESSHYSIPNTTSFPPTRRKDTWTSEWDSPDASADTNDVIGNSTPNTSIGIGSNEKSVIDVNRETTKSPSQITSKINPSNIPSKRPVIQNQTLGAEFDISVKTTASKSNELDFFADMQPDIASKPTVVIQNSKPSVSEMFKPDDGLNGNEAADGWDEEGWDDMD